jgi:Replication-relaxation
MIQSTNPRPVKRNGRGMLLTARDSDIVHTVAECGAVTREQLERHHRFGSTVRANATLLRLVRHSYLARRFQPTLVGTRRAIYVLAGRGRELVGEDPPRLRDASDLFLDHRLMVNDIRFSFVDCAVPEFRVLRWTNEGDLRRHQLPVISDGYVEYALDEGIFAAFIEADRGTEGRHRWQAKTQGYLELAFSGLYERRFGRRFFRVLVVAPTAERVAVLASEIRPLTDRIFWLTPLSDLLASGPFSPIWWRPNGDDRHSLTET